MPETQHWQAALWRILSQDLANDPLPLDAQTDDAPYTSRSQVHQAFLQALRHWPEDRPIPGLPPRLMVFGVTSLPMQTVEALAALGRVCQVLMWVHNPCQYHWAHVVDARVPLRQSLQKRQPLREGLPTPDAHGALSTQAQFELHCEAHPLLAAWGKHGRDYLHLIDGFDDTTRYRHRFERIDLFIDPAQTSTEPHHTPSALQQMQSAVLHLSPEPASAAELDARDDSIRFHEHYSAQREVEALHDQILAWLDADAQLQARDIMVMVPDMAQFAPHIHAVFGRFAPGESRHVPYSVADTAEQEEPLVQALSQLLQLPQLRITRTQWQSWFEVAPVRHRFGLEAADVTQIGHWLDDAAVRWGLDAQHRSQWGIDAAAPDAEQNSWLFGLQRLLLGYAQGAQADDAIWQDTLAVPAVGGLDAPLVDGLLQWLRHLQWALVKLRQDHSPTEWGAVLQQLMGLFFKASNEADERLIERVMAPLEIWLAECQLARFDSPVPLAVVREHWLAQLSQAPMHKRFFGGGVQFATLMPMRSIPFKCVCLLGMNDGDYPRSQTPCDFDLMSDAAHAGQASSFAQTHWRAGDRSRREDDRYLFLEAVLSARERLYISWQGRRTTDHEIKPPSVLVAQLMDHLNAVWTRGDADGAPAFKATLHPLQAFSTKYFTQGSSFQTYADDWQRALPHHAVLNHSLLNPALHTPLRDDDAPAPSALTLAHLRRLLKQPVEVFLHDRLRLQLDEPEDAAQEQEPFSLNGLDKYRITQRIVQADDEHRALDHLRLSGQLALAGFGQAQQARLLRDRQTLREPLDAWLQQWPQPLDVQSADWSLGVTHLHAEWANGSSLWRCNGHAWLQVALRAGAVTAGKKGNLLPRIDTLSHLWLHHLAACASGTPTTSVQLGLDAALQLNPISADAAQAHLQDLCEAYAQAWAQPLPVAAKTACAFVLAAPIEGQEEGQDRLAKARAAFESAHQRKGEYAQSTSLQRVFDGFDDIAQGLQTWAERLYAPMLHAAEIKALNDAEARS